MLIASKNKNQFINIDDFGSVFVNSDRRIVCASAAGRNTVLDEYDTRAAALKAMEILIEHIRVATDKTNIVFMPADVEVEAALSGQREYYRHIDGKKTKGHGGS